MSKLIWDAVGAHIYEAGVQQGVLYPVAAGGTYPLGVAWNGLISVTEKPSGAEASKKYADNIQYLSMVSAEKFGASIEAYTYPEEFGQCDGSAELADGVVIGQQARKAFGLCYKTVMGNDVDGDEHGYKLHIVYGALASPSEKGYSTINDSPEAMTLNWDITTTPVKVTGKKPTAILTIDSTKADATKLAALEVILYGKDPTTTEATDGVAPRLPLPDEIATLMATAS